MSSISLFLKIKSKVILNDNPLCTSICTAPYPGGTLSRLISHSPRGRLPCDLARTYTAEIALALNFMHEKGIIYRGMKLLSCLIEKRSGNLLTETAQT